jgi:hypothetical protein
MKSMDKIIDMEKVNGVISDVHLLRGQQSIFSLMEEDSLGGVYVECLYTTYYLGTDFNSQAENIIKPGYYVECKGIIRSVEDLLESGEDIEKLGNMPIMECIEVKRLDFKLYDYREYKSEPKGVEHFIILSHTMH